jgi:hypothetical protein
MYFIYSYVKKPLNEEFGRLQVRGDHVGDKSANTNYYRGIDSKNTMPILSQTPTLK